MSEQMLYEGTIVYAKEPIGEMVKRKERGVVVDIVPSKRGTQYTVLFEHGWIEEMLGEDVGRYLLVTSERVTSPCSGSVS